MSNGEENMSASAPRLGLIEPPLPLYHTQALGRKQRGARAPLASRWPARGIFSVISHLGEDTITTAQMLKLLLTGTDMRNRLMLAPLFLALIVLNLSSLRGDDEIDRGPKELKHLKYRLIGPHAGGRVTRAAGVPGDLLTSYFAAASGGVWKSSDGGLSWKPIFDDQPVSSIGSIAIAPSDPNVIYVGTGEANIRGNVEAGNGIYVSTDAGKTFKHVWKQEGQIGQMLVHPTDPKTAYAAVLGHAFGPNLERGVYRTTDGGKTWQQVLKKDADTGAIDVCFHPTNPRILLAALWQTRRLPWTMTSGGPGGGLYLSHDGGETWKQLKEKGLPEGIWGRIGLAWAPSDARRVYALIEAEKGGLFRSDDGGETWELINSKRYLRQRPWYFSNLTVDPSNPDVIWAPSVRLLKSIDGGKTFKQVKGPHHGDHHDLWIDPKNPRRIIASNDGGVDISTNGGETWHAPPLPISQFYHISVDTRTPYHVMGNMQDLGTAAGPSNSLTTAGIQMGDWYAVGGGETGFSVPDPSDPNIVYAGEYGGYVSRWDKRTRQARNISVYPFNPSGHGAEALRYRFQWTAPILVSPHNPKMVYHAANVLFRTTNDGQTWDRLSPDLTRNDKSKQQWSGGPITGDNTGVEVYGTIFATAESPREPGLLWTGSDDGLVHVSRDGGKNWENVTSNISGLPEWATVRSIEPSPHDAGTAYLVAEAHKLDNMKPYLWVTTDYGKTWKSLSAKLDQDVYLHVVREDPKVKGMLYLGTQRGVMFSRDGGAAWDKLRLNLPTVSVQDLVVKGDDLVVGTSGRSIWIFDDLTPVRQFASLHDKTLHVYPPRPAVRWRYHSPIYSTEEKHTGDNPAKGAVLYYQLGKEEKGELTLEVLDAEGKRVRKLTSKEKKDHLDPDDPDGPEEEEKKSELKREEGINRLVWDLRYEGAREIAKAKVDSGNPKHGPLANPGIYTLRLTLTRDGKKQVTRETKVEVRADPRVRISPTELDEQLRLTLRVRDDVSELAEMVNQLRAVRKQMRGQVALLKGDDMAKEYIEAGRELLKKLDHLEDKLHNPKAEVTYDILAMKGGAQLYSQLCFLFEALKESDGMPTQGVREVYAEEAGKLIQLRKQWEEIVRQDLARLNQMARRLEIPNLLLPRQKKGD
jgi:photosystem II stability/assembly factor-like uncharacterized protein